MENVRLDTYEEPRVHRTILVLAARVFESSSKTCKSQYRDGFELARMFLEFRLRRTVTADMAVLPGVLGCRTLRRTVRGPTPCAFPVAQPSPRSRDNKS